MLRQLKPLSSSLHLCRPDFDRAARTPALEQLAGQVGFSRVSTHETVEEAVKRATMRGPTLICGSFHVAEEAVRALKS